MKGTLLADFVARAARHPEREAFREGAAGHSWSWHDWEAAAWRLAVLLVDAGVAPGDRIAVWADNRWLWPVADVGILLAGAVSVGLYPTSAPAQVVEVLRDSGARWLLTDSPARATVIMSRDEALPSLQRVVTFAAHTDLPPPAKRTAAEARAAAVGPEDLAMLIYTSGSTGEPKGAMLSHRCLADSVDAIHDVLGWREDDLVLAFLPFNHAAERITGLWSRVRYGHAAVLVEDHRALWEVARATQPTVFGGLPRFYEKIAEAMRASADRRQVLADHLGSRLRLATSGGAALPVAVAEEFARAGVELLGAYGLTEHLCVAFNRSGHARHDVAGPPMQGTELRIADDGEILVHRSTLTFSGYWRRPDATRVAFTADGEWLCTGDLGAIESDGALRVTGRKKELIALSTGKKVAPAPIETALRALPGVSQVVVVGEGRKHLAALIFVSSAAQTEDGDDAAIRAAIDIVNRDRSPTEQVRRWVVIVGELTETAGELTPTLKVRRDVVAARYASQIEECYA